MKENMKEEVIVISAYCPTLKKQDKLRDLVRKVKSMNHDIILVSHSIIPSDIIESCDYHLYDKENKLLHSILLPSLPASTRVAKPNSFK